MKVGILTFYKSINPGAFLQCYCLQEYLKSQGIEVYIIKYYSFKHRFNEIRRILLKKNPIKSISYFLKYLSINKSIRENFKMIGVSSIAKLDTIIIGSDIVWDFKNSFFGFDSKYFGEIRESNKKTISYAASCGKTKYNEYLDQIAKLISKNFDQISVRDDNTFNLVDKKCNKKAEIVLDPVFMYNLNTPIIQDKSYIVVYGLYFNKNVVKEIKDFSKKNKLKIISIGYYNKWADTNKIGIDPFKWASYIKNADYVVSATFHGTLFSIIYEKQFCYISNEATDTKLSTTLNYLEIYTQKYENGKLENIFLNKINYSNVNNLLSKKIKSSKSWLIKNL